MISRNLKRRIGGSPHVRDFPEDELLLNCNVVPGPCIEKLLYSVRNPSCLQDFRLLRRQYIKFHWHFKLINAIISTIILIFFE